jgi:hypothetical protein
VPLVLRDDLTLEQNKDTRARLERWVCIGCGHEWRGSVVPAYCRECGVIGGYAPVEIEIVGVRSGEIGRVQTGTLVTEWAPALPRGLPLGRSLLLRGRPGAGKSRVAFRLAGQLGKAMIFGLEMGNELSLDSANNAGAKLDEILWYEGLEGLSDLDAVNPDVVVIDSIQKLRKDRRRTVDRLMQWAKDFDRNLILVSQLSAEGKSRYGEDDDFDVDMTVDIWAGRHPKHGPRKDLHGLEDEPRHCADGCAHASVAKSRVCPLVAFDVPIVAGY